MNCKRQATSRAVGSYVNFTGLSKLPRCREEPCCQAESQRFLLSPESGDVKATIAVLSFILSSAAKHRVDSDSLSSELQQLGLPKEHATGLCRSYEEKQSPLQDSLRTRSLRSPCAPEVYCARRGLRHDGALCHDRVGREVPGLTGRAETGARHDENSQLRSREDVSECGRSRLIVLQPVRESGGCGSSTGEAPCCTRLQTLPGQRLDWTLSSLLRPLQLKLTTALPTLPGYCPPGLPSSCLAVKPLARPSSILPTSPCASRSPTPGSIPRAMVDGSLVASASANEISTSRPASARSSHNKGVQTHGQCHCVTHMPPENTQACRLEAALTVRDPNIPCPALCGWLCS
ncbi:uncharacterized protein LOC127058557 [Gopherus flavomarginatus]|uniref:uncharacterized protein LOC127058557 n=1 Tax=Gopherus flavomarginatus TaxID=286002 RepID=UPI0021CBF5F8|nr:uncharacterized protein LOC127058557 [Gopherus flavomarginatus]